MRVIGLTGGIAMGKSTATAMLSYMGVRVHDADATVHRLYARGGNAVAPVGALFPEAVVDDSIDRGLLGAQVLGNPENLAALESVMHPLVRQASEQWLNIQRRQRLPLVVLDIPLLFETGRERGVDEVWVVDCPPWLQRRRALARPGMTHQKLESILDRQTNQAQRLAFATCVFQTGAGKARLFRALKAELNARRYTRAEV